MNIVESIFTMIVSTLFILFFLGLDLEGNGMMEVFQEHFLLVVKVG